MSCASCAVRAERALDAVAGVREASVNFATASAQILLDGASGAEVAAALEGAGCPARAERIRIAIGGMSCAACAGRIERAILALPGALSASVNFATGTAEAQILGDDADALLRAVAEAGYEARIAAAGERQQDGAERGALRRAIIACALAAPIVAAEMGGHAFPALHRALHGLAGTQALWSVQFVLATLSLFGPGREFLRIGIPALLKGRPDMNSLVALGCLAAWGHSTLCLVAPSLVPQDSRVVYFEAAAAIIALVLLGRWLEARAKGQTGEAVRRLVGLRPPTARVERDGAVSEIPVERLRVGDIVLLQPGERVPADGEIVRGESHVDESALTGEPLPAAKGPGDSLIGGAINAEGALAFRAMRVGADTVLAQIVEMVERAQGAKLPIQSAADRVVRVFVPIVLVIAAAAAAAWLAAGPEPKLARALVAGVSVLIIACPCAMGLATPTSVVVGTGRAAELGALFRRGDALQRLEGVRVVAFDKTGTLTQGAPRIAETTPFGALDSTQTLRLAAGAEAQSGHPLGQAVAAAAQEQGLEIPAAESVKAIPGFGLAAQVQGHAVLIGARRLMEREGVCLAEAAEAAAAAEAKGRTPVFVALDGALAAMLALADPLKTEARAALAALARRGVATAMITGDSRAAAAAIAREAGIGAVEAEALPGDKAGMVADLRARHGPVAFVGDGINDAPALAEADVGIAIGTGADVAVEAADVVLVSGSLAGVPTALEASRATMVNIRQNLFWAFAYNAALVPVAAGALFPLTGTLLSPALAAAAMAASSLFVVGNALRLRRLGPAVG